METINLKLTKTQILDLHNTRAKNFIEDQPDRFEIFCDENSNEVDSVKFPTATDYIDLFPTGKWKKESSSLLWFDTKLDVMVYANYINSETDNDCLILGDLAEYNDNGYCCLVDLPVDMKL